MLVPVKRSQWKMTAILRSITLLDVTFTQVSSTIAFSQALTIILIFMKAAIARTMSKEIPQLTNTMAKGLKRRIGYDIEDSDDEGTPAKRMSDMHIGQENIE